MWQTVPSINKASYRVKNLCANIKLMGKLEKIFNHWTLLAINLVIIVAVEATGMFFMQSGLIHLIALLFIGLGISRIFVHYEVYDRFLKPLIYGGIAVLILFAVSHILEYLNYAVFYLPFPMIAANVVNFYLVGLVIVTFSTTFFLKGIEKGTTFYRYTLPLITVFLVIVTIRNYLNPSLVDLGPNKALMYIYASGVVGATILGVYWLLRLKKYESMLASFIDYFNASFIMIGVSATFYVFNEIFEKVGIDYMQVMYISHFLFYGALSFMFLSFVRLTKLGGLYDAAKKEKKPEDLLNEKLQSS